MITRPTIVKFLYTFLLFMVTEALLSSCSKDKTSVNTCHVSQEVAERYSEDARRLLYREIYFDTLHPARQQPSFDPEEVTSLLEAFQAVYSLTIPERDTVVEVYGISTFPDLGLYSIALQVDPEAEEIINLIAGNPTQHPVFDSILTSFSLAEVRPSLFYPDFNWVTIISDKPWNLLPFCEGLAALEFIFIAGPGGGAAGDGNNIVLFREQSGIRLDFSIGWGDCPAGCIYRRHWIFEVDENCSASLIHSFTE